MVIHINYISLATGTMIASMRFEWFQYTFEALVLIFAEVWLPAVAIQEGHKAFIPFIY